MTLLIGFLTAILVADCLLLILLILIQLPKKEAGAGVAFGGAATDALFGAGQGNALTKLTKYSAGIFIVLALSLSLLNSHHAQQGNRKLEEILEKKASASAATQVVPPPVAGSVTSQPVALGTQNLRTVAPAAVTNPPPVAAGTRPAATNAKIQLPAATNQKPATASPPATNSPAARPK